MCTGTVGRDEPVEGDVMEKREPQCRWQTCTSKEREMATKATRKTYGSHYDHERDEQVINRFQAEATLRLRNKAALKKKKTEEWLRKLEMLQPDGKNRQLAEGQADMEVETGR